MKSAPSLTFRIWIAGDYADALRACREFCSNEGACFAVTRAAYAYTGGMEDGVCVTLINYPRFPSSEPELADKAMRLGEHLMERLFQDSFTVEGPTETVWVSTRVTMRDAP
jgi:hypothetical protein